MYLRSKAILALKSRCSYYSIIYTEDKAWAPPF